MSMSIGNKIREARKKAGLTQEELAIALNVKRATISRYETGNINIPSAQISEIAKTLNVSVLDLYDVAPERKREVEKNVDDVYNFWNDIGETISKDKLRALFEHDAVATEPYHKYCDAREKAYAAIKNAMDGIDEELLIALLLEKYTSLNRTGKIIAVMLLDSLDATGDFRNYIEDE